MLIPVRCFTCGRVIGEDYEVFKTRLKNGENPKMVLNDLGIDRVCCRRLFVAHPYNPKDDKEPIDEILPYK
jgi:DNA-directed RNA polymerase subunit N